MATEEGEMYSVDLAVIQAARNKNVASVMAHFLKCASNIPQHVIEEYTDDSRKTIAYHAIKRSKNRQTLEKHAKSKFYILRKAVAENPLTDDNILEELSLDHVDSIRDAIMSRPKINKSILDNINMFRVLNS